jgi:hypothetical protein
MTDLRISCVPVSGWGKGDYFLVTGQREIATLLDISRRRVILLEVFSGVLIQGSLNAGLFAGESQTLEEVHSR